MYRVKEAKSRKFFVSGGGRPIAKGIWKAHGTMKDASGCALSRVRERARKI
jgi:hypothetical protein